MENESDDLLKRLIIADASFLTLSEKINLQNKLDTAARLALMSINTVSETVGRVLKTASWNGESYMAKAKTAFRLISALGISWTAFDKDDYPAMLREMNDPPYMIFYRGTLDTLKNKCVSVVGTRRAGPGARKAAVQFGRDAALDGCTVVSGLAFGIDICAHRGALSALDSVNNGAKLGAKHGATAAVLPSGIDTIVPQPHTKTAARIIEEGGIVLSEYTPGTPAMNFRFVQRNRIIAALSPATVVIQAPAGSGALITASFALEYGRDVLFHSEAFSPEAKMLDEANEHDIQAEIARGKNVSHKLENSPEKYRSDGAPVIGNYAEYCSACAQAPGTVSGKKDNKQLNLF